MNHDWYEDYYRQSRGYGPGEIADLYRQPAKPSTSVPREFQGRFATPAEYDAWVRERWSNYTNGY